MILFADVVSTSSLLCLSLLHFLWQGALIVAAATVAGKLLQRISPRAEYVALATGLLLLPVVFGGTTVWLAGQLSPSPVAVATTPQPEVPLAAPVEMPAMTVPQMPHVDAGQIEASGPALPMPIPAAAPLQRAALPESPTTSWNWQVYAPWLVGLYLAGVLAMCARLLVGLSGGRRLCQESVPVEERGLLQLLSQLGARLHLRRLPTLAYCRDVAVPTVVGVLRPMILLPLAMTTGLPMAEMESILLHELAHIRRYDPLLNLAQRLIEAVFFFHPAVWLLSRRMGMVREHCCDDVVLALGAARQTYVDSLLRVADLSLPETDTTRRAALAGLNVTGNPSQLRLRIARLLGLPTPAEVRLKPAGLVVMGLVVAGLLVTPLILQTMAAPPAKAPNEADAKNEWGLSHDDSVALANSLNAISIRYAQDQMGKDSPNEEIPEKYWSDEVRKLQPLRVLERSGNVVVVMRSDALREDGLYYITPASPLNEKMGAWPYGRAEFEASLIDTEKDKLRTVQYPSPAAHPGWGTSLRPYTLDRFGENAEESATLPSDAPVFRGKVVDQEGKPLGRARLTAQLLAADQALRWATYGRLRATTDAQGRFNLPVPMADVLYGISAERIDCSNAWVFCTANKGKDELTITLERVKGSSVVKGQVIGAKTMRLDLVSEYGTVGTTKTDDKGNFEFSGLPAYSGQGSLVGRQNGRCVEAMLVRANDNVTAKLVDEGTIAGRVHLATDKTQGIFMAKVTVQPAFASGVRYTVQSGPEGEFRLSVPPGEYILAAESPGYFDKPPRGSASDRPQFRVTAKGETVANIAMQWKATLKGMVKNEAGIPVRNAMVGTLVTWNGDYRDQGGWAWTDKEGRYELPTGHVEESLMVAAFSAEHGSQAMRVVVPAPGFAANDVNLSLPGVARMRGVVTDEQNRPIRDVLCKLRSSDAMMLSDAEGKFDLGQVSLTTPHKLVMTFEAPRPPRGQFGKGLPDRLLNGKKLDGLRYFYDHQLEVPDAKDGVIEVQEKLGETQLLSVRGKLLDRNGEPAGPGAVALFAGNASDNWLDTGLLSTEIRGSRIAIANDALVAKYPVNNKGEFEIPVVRAEGEKTDKGTRFSLGCKVGNAIQQLVKDLVIPEDSRALALTINVDGVAEQKLESNSPEVNQAEPDEPPSVRGGSEDRADPPDGAEHGPQAGRQPTLQNTLKTISKSAWENVPSLSGEESETYGRMMRLQSGKGGYIPKASDEADLVKALNDASYDLPARLCIAGFLIEFDNADGQKFLKDAADSNDQRTAQEAIHVLLYHLHPERKVDWGTQKLLELMATDNLFKTAGSTVLVDRLGRLKLNVPQVGTDKKIEFEYRDLEPELIAALKRHPDRYGLAEAVAQFKDDGATAALVEAAASKSFNLMAAILLVQQKNREILPILLKHLDKVDVIMLVGDLGDATALKPLRDALEATRSAEDATELRLTIVRLEAKGDADLADRLGRMLHDPQTTNLSRVIGVLEKTKQPSMIEPIARLLKTSTNTGVLMDGIFALQSLNNVEATRVLVELLDRDFTEEPRGKPSAPFVLKDRVISALEKKTGKKFGGDKAKWEEYLKNAAVQPQLESLKVEWRSNDSRNPTLTVRGDGTYTYELPTLVKVPGEDRWVPGKEPYRANYRLAPTDLRKIIGLLETLEWMKRPARPIDPTIKDGTQFALMLTKDATVTEVVVQDGKAEQNEPLVRLLRQVEHQERMLYDLTQGDDAKFATHMLGSELDSVAGKPSTVPVYAPILDYRRLRPTIQNWLAAPEKHTEEELTVARQVLALSNGQDDSATSDNSGTQAPGNKEAETSISFDEMLKGVSEPPADTPRMTRHEGESRVFERMQIVGRYVPDSKDVQRLLQSMKDDTLDLPKRLCLAGYLLELDNQDARKFLLEYLEGNDPNAMAEAAQALMFHVHPERKYDFARQQLLGLVASDRFFKPNGSIYLVGHLAKLKLNVPPQPLDPAAAKPIMDLWDAEQELIAAYLRHPEIHDTDMAKVLEQLGTDKAFAALAESVESPKKFRDMPAYILVKHRRPGIDAILLRHLDNVAAVQFLGDLQERGTLPALRDYLEKNPKAQTAAELRLSIERTAAKDGDDLIARLTPMLNDPDAVSPGRIVSLMEETNRPAAVAPILDLLKTSDNISLLQTGAYTLQRIGGKEALQALVALLERDISYKEIRSKPTIPFVYRKFIVELLEAKTGKKFGEDKAKWEAYVNALPEGRADLEKAGDKVDGLQAVIRLERSEFKAGEPIKVEWEIRNVSDEKRVIIWHPHNWCPVVFDITGPVSLPGGPGPDGKTRSNLRDPAWDVFSDKFPPEPVVLAPRQSQKGTFELNHFWRDLQGEYTVVGAYAPKDVKQLEWYLKNEWIKPEMVARVTSGPLKIKVVAAGEKEGAKGAASGDQPTVAPEDQVSEAERTQVLDLFRRIQSRIASLEAEHPALSGFSKENGLGMEKAAEPGPKLTDGRVSLLFNSNATELGKTAEPHAVDPKQPFCRIQISLVRERNVPGQPTATSRTIMVAGKSWSADGRIDTSDEKLKQQVEGIFKAEVTALRGEGKEGQPGANGEAPPAPAPPMKKPGDPGQEKDRDAEWKPGRIPPPGPEVELPENVRTLIGRLCSEKPAERFQAAEGLGMQQEKGKPAIPWLVDLLHDPYEEPIDENAVQLPKPMPPRIIPAAKAAWALVTIGPPALEEVIRALGDRDVRVRRLIAHETDSEFDARIIPPLIKALQDDDTKLRASALHALGRLAEYERLGRKAVEPAVQPVLALGNDKDLQVRKQAVEALGKIHCPEAVAVLIAALNDPDQSIQMQAANSLETYGDRKTIPALITALDGDEELRERASLRLEEMTEQAFGKDRTKWQEWWKTARATWLPADQSVVEVRTMKLQDGFLQRAFGFDAERFATNRPAEPTSQDITLQSKAGNWQVLTTGLMTVEANFSDGLSVEGNMDISNAAFSLENARKMLANANAVTLTLSPRDLPRFFQTAKGVIGVFRLKNLKITGPGPVSAQVEYRILAAAPAKEQPPVGKEPDKNPNESKWKPGTIPPFDDEVYATEELKKQVKRICSADPRERAAGAAELAKMGENAEQAMAWLIDLLRDPYEEPLDDKPLHATQARIVPSEFAAQALVAIGPKAVNVLIEALREGDLRSRQSVAWNLGWGADARLAAALIKSLGDREPIVRAGAARSLASMVDNQKIEPAALEPAVKPLLKLFKDESGLVREAAVRVFWSFRSPDAVEPLIAAMKVTGGMDDYAIRALGNSQDRRAIEPLIGALEGGIDETRRHAAESLRSLTGQNFGADKAKWQEYLKANPPAEKSGAAWKPSSGKIGFDRESLAKLGMSTVDFAEIVQALPSENPAERAHSARRLQNMKEKGAPAIPLLVHLLHDPYVEPEQAFVDSAHEKVVPAHAAAAALLAIGPEAVPAVINAFSDVDPRAREAVAHAARWAKESKLIAPLVRAIDDRDAAVRSAATFSLGHMAMMSGLDRQEFQPAVKPLIAAMKGGDSTSREYAARAFWSLRDPAAIEPLIALVNYPNVMTSDSAIQALSNFKDRRVVDALIAALDIEGILRQRRVAEALETLTGQTFADDKAKWKAWWQTNRDKWQPAEPDKETETGWSKPNDSGWRVRVTMGQAKFAANDAPVLSVEFRNQMEPLATPPGAKFGTAYVSTLYRLEIDGQKYAGQNQDYLIPYEFRHTPQGWKLTTNLNSGWVEFDEKAEARANEVPLKLKPGKHQLRITVHPTKAAPIVSEPVTFEVADETRKEGTPADKPTEGETGNAKPGDPAPNVKPAPAPNGAKVFLEEKPVEFTWGERKGRVLDYDGKPIAGAKVEFQWFDGIMRGGIVGIRPIGNVEADQEGYFKLPDLPEHLGTIRGGVFAKGYYARGFNLSQRNNKPPVVYLERTVTIRGRLIAVDGKPLARAPLSLQTQPERQHPVEYGGGDGNFARAITDEQGEFVMTDVPPGRHLLQYPWTGPSRDDLDTKRWDKFIPPGQATVPIPVSGRIGATAIVIREGEGDPEPVRMALNMSDCAVEGRLLDDNQQPVPGIKVALAMRSDVVGNGQPIVAANDPPAVTDAEGHFRLSGLPNGTWCLIAWDNNGNGYSNLIDVTLASGKTARQDLRSLKPAPKK